VNNDQLAILTFWGGMCFIGAFLSWFFRAELTRGLRAFRAFIQRKK